MSQDRSGFTTDEMVAQFAHRVRGEGLATRAAQVAAILTELGYEAEADRA